MEKLIINSNKAPAAVGPYSQAVQYQGIIYLSGQIPLTVDGNIVEGSIAEEAAQVFDNMKAVCQAAGGDLHDVLKLNLFLTDMAYFAEVNEVMMRYFQPPYPARACVAVKELPKGVRIEADGIMKAN